MLGETMVIHLAVVPDNGEDSFAVSSLPGSVMLCVADGCGGLGSKRYDKLDHRTGAYLASRLAVRAMLGWAEEHRQVPLLLQQGNDQLMDLQLEVGATFDGFAQMHCQEDSACRIVGSMQRTLPTTLCALLADESNAACSFVWAGDSRGYALDESGLHQYTQDDVRGHADAMDSLLLDLPLSNLICAGQPVKLRMRRFAMPQKALLFCMTDGVYQSASSPMELEMLLLDTMLHSANEKRWQRKLEKTLNAAIQDDATLLCCACGFTDYEEIKLYFQPRFEQLKQKYITPVRRKRGNREVARILWERYKEHYDRTEGMANDQQDWRI